MKSLKRFFAVTAAAMIFLLLSAPAQAEIYTLNIEGPIETITEEYFTDAFKTIRADADARLVVLLMDTPGGFSTTMRVMIKEIMASPVPVAVYVTPRGARAASAGIFLVVASDIAAMSPGTNTGAASPVNATGGKMEETMKAKVFNDSISYIKSLAKTRNRNQELAEKAVSEAKSYTAEECLKENLIEYIAKDLRDLLNQLDGKTITMVDGKKVVLELKGRKIITVELTPRQKFLKTITNPSLAYFLLMIGLLGLYLEFSHPGMIVPGVLGAICLLLAFMAFQVLPINYVGLILIFLSIGLFLAEVKIQGFGMFGIGGIIAFVLGSIMLIDTPIPEMRPAMSIIITFAITFAAVFLFLAYKVVQAMNKKPQTGQEGLAGETGTARSDVTADAGRVFVHGEWWNAVSASGETIPKGARVKVDALENFVLKVSPV